jgi:secernin
MASDMLVALARATPDQTTLFGHNSNRRRGEAATLVQTPGREHSPGEHVQVGELLLPQARHTWAVLAGRPGNAWGYTHGVNEKGVAVGGTSIDTVLECGQPCLSGTDLVRLALERGGSARHAVEVVTDLICRHGQGPTGTESEAAAESGRNAALLLADAEEAFVLEATGQHWALGHVGSVRAVAGACMLRQDWDRISRGLSDLAIARGWWPQDGCKLDFAGALGRRQPDHAQTLRRWGQATMTLEHHSGQVDLPLVRWLLRDLAEMVAPHEGPPGQEETAASLIVRLGPLPHDLPVAWYAPGSPAVSVYLPVFPFGELPRSYSGPLWLALAALLEEGRGNPELRAALHSALAGLQEQLDEHLHDFAGEARHLHRRGAADELRKLAGSFMQHSVERLEEMLDALCGRPGESGGKQPDELVIQGANF